MSAEDVHATSAETGRAYCGHRTKKTTDAWKRVTCSDCQAAHRADQENRS